ncbi:LysR family transcriptional regulator [Pelagibius marinus]|uniref:LysR family transcriptional regulator n=1 Tax=Pelagibius marinus TaxID=2762760 RepID=UPI001872566E|nr:LysR family transcriptional regulator [Pelagibius marinus]
MDWLKLPPLNGLRAFSVLAETGSYTLAAERLNVTHAAVSQQVKALESRLGTALVVRTGRRIQLTDEGAALARDLENGFGTIARGIERLSEVAAERPVQVTMSPAFAVEWLMPRIMEFQYENPGITLMLNPTPELMELKPGGIDVAIRYRDRRRPQPDVRSVLVSDMIVVGTPSLVGSRDLRDPAALAELPWLQELGTNEVGEWFTYHGIVPERPLTVNHMPGNLIMDAVRRGDGITYTARAFFKEDLEAGKVVELFSEPAFGIYYVETPPGPIRPTVGLFLDWLMSKAETVLA